MQFDEQRVQWHFAVWRWLLENFGGMETLNQQQLITPTPDFFPLRVRNEHAYFEEVLQAVKETMGMADWPCTLEPLDDHNPGEDLIRNHMLQGEWKTGGPGGTFQWSEEGVIIQYAPSKVSDPIGLVATMAHELCHYLLATAKTDPPGGWVDHELHTDMACSFRGYGIFQSNTAFNFQQWGDAFQSGWRTSRQGYLGESEHAYGLALFTVLRGIDPAVVKGFLKTNPRTFFEVALEDLQHREFELGQLRRITKDGMSSSKIESSVRPEDKTPTVGTPRLTLEQVHSLTFRNPAGEPLWQLFWDLTQQQNCEHWHQCEFAALDLLQPPLRDLLLVVRFILMQQQFGLQTAILLECDNTIADSEKMLRMTAAAFKTFRDEGREQFLLSLVPLIRQHLEEFDQAVAEDRIEEFMSPLDQDDHWSGLGEDYHHEMRKQIDWHPDRYTYPPASS